MQTPSAPFRAARTVGRAAGASPELRARAFACLVIVLTAGTVTLMVRLEEYWAGLLTSFLVGALWFACHNGRLPAVLGQMMLLAFLVHIALAAGIRTALLVNGNGFVTADDAVYADISWRLAQVIRGDELERPIVYSAEGYLLGTFVYLGALAFAVFGPQILVVQLLIVLCSIAAMAISSHIGAKLFSPRAGLVAAALVGFYPSLTLWSALYLKDIVVLTVALAILALILRLQHRPDWGGLTATAGLLVLLTGLRSFVFIGLAVLIPVGVALSPRLTPPARVRWTLRTAAVSAALVAAHFVTVGSPPQPVQQLLETQREKNTIGARTAFREIPVVAREGETYRVTVSSDASAAASPAVIHVAPNTRLVLEVASPHGDGPASGPGRDGTVQVRPGDLVVVGGQAPANAADIKPLRLPSEGSVSVATSDKSETGALLRNAAYLPIGLTYALFAPFPWDVRRALDVLVVPEMILWYICLAAAVITITNTRDRWRAVAPSVLFTAGILLVLALAEGNVGSLFRHRSMIVPAVLVFAAPTLLRWTAAALRRRA